jgi:gliding motility-associated protein GldM
VPTAATLTLLTKMQTDIRNAESDVVKYLYSSVDAASFKFNKLEAAVISPSNYVITGDTFRAQVFLAAFDSTQNPVIQIGESVDSSSNTVNGDTLEIDIREGKGFLNIPAKTVGDYHYAGVIKIKNPSTKEYNPYLFDFDYKVASPSTTISATKMNVFYIGVDNPVAIAAAGVAQDQIQASISNGSISKSKDGWTVRVTSPGKTVVSVAANMEVDGQMTRKNMGNMEFRAMKIPTPTAKIASKTGGAINKNQLAAQIGLVADMGDFVFDVKVLVQEFDFTYVAANGLTKEMSSKSYKLTPEMQTVIRQLRPGSRVTFEKIKVKMPDGEVRTLSPIVLKLV